MTHTKCECGAYADGFIDDGISGDAECAFHLAHSSASKGILHLAYELDRLGIVGYDIVAEVAASISLSDVLDELTMFPNRLCGVNTDGESSLRESVQSFDNQCTARTRANRRCKNQVFDVQWFGYTTTFIRELRNGVSLHRAELDVSDENLVRMEAHVCRVHEETFSGTTA